MGKKVVKKAETKKVEVKEVKKDEKPVTKKKVVTKTKKNTKELAKEAEDMLKKQTSGVEFKRLSDKELKALENAVHEDNDFFEEMMAGVLLRREWYELLNDAIKHKGKTLKKEDKDRLTRIAKFAEECCEDEVIGVTLHHFSGDVSKRRRRLSVERSLQKKDNGENMSPIEKLLAEIYSSEKKDK